MRIMLQDITQVVLARALDATAMRNRAIANNVANVETPGYTRQDVAFEGHLKVALDSMRADEPLSVTDVKSVQPESTIDGAQPVRENGNNVDMDREMARLAENSIRYQAILQSLSIKGSMLRTAIYEGRR